MYHFNVFILLLATFALPDLVLTCQITKYFSFPILYDESIMACIVLDNMGTNMNMFLISPQNICCVTH